MLFRSLAHFSRLKVIGRNSSFQFKGKSVDLREIGEKLGARYLLEGSVRRDGDNVRITAQLIEAVTGSHLWAERYDRPFKELFAIGDEVVNRVARALAVQILAAETVVVQRKPPEKMDAYDLTLKARALRIRGDRDSIFEARRLLERAIETEPTYAPAYAYLTQVLNNFNNNRWNDEYASPRTVERLLAVATRAYQLDPKDAYVLAQYGVALSSAGQFDQALTIAERAIAAGPNDADVLFAAANALTRGGRPERGIEVILAAYNIDPDNATTSNNNLAIGYFLIGQFTDAIAAGRTCVEIGRAHV